MNVLIYGYGLKNGGFYSASYFLKKGHNVRITDIRDEFSLGDGAAFLQSQGAAIISGEHRVEDFKWADIIIKTPAIAPDSPFLEFGKCTTNDFAFLFKNISAKNIKFIGVTGTQGKSLTSAAVCHALNKLGKKATMCGNMGISPFSVLEKIEAGNRLQYIVCEFSSSSIRDTFEYASDTFPTFEVVSFADSAKETDERTSETIRILCNKIESFRKKSKKILCFAETKNTIASLINRNSKSIGSIEYYSSSMQKTIPENLRIAYGILRQLGFNASSINKALKSFKGIPNKNEIVKSNSNLIVINDSSSTIPRATEFSVENLEGMAVHIICGGSGRYLNPIPLIETLKKVASVTLLDGSFTRNILIKELDKAGVSYTGPFTDMKKAVKSAMSAIKPKKNTTQVLILSPGCSAFEFFTNEYERGDSFKACFRDTNKAETNKNADKQSQKEKQVSSKSETEKKKPASEEKKSSPKEKSAGK